MSKGNIQSLVNLRATRSLISAGRIALGTLGSGIPCLHYGTSQR